MTADYTLGFVQRDGNMHDWKSFGEELGLAVEALDSKRERSNPHQIHWYVYDADEPERGCFDEVPQD